MNIPTGMVTSHYLVACMLSHKKKKFHIRKSLKVCGLSFIFPQISFPAFLSQYILPFHEYGINFQLASITRLCTPLVENEVSQAFNFS